MQQLDEKELERKLKKDQKVSIKFVFLRSLLISSCTFLVLVVIGWPETGDVVKVNIQN
jgi:hypothetical protein